MRVKGIDVSRHQGAIDWEKVAADGIHFVIIRVGYRGLFSGILTEDPYFRENIEGAIANGIDVGAYIYCTSINEKEAAEEANFLLERINPYNLTMPVCFDYEGFSNSANRNYGMSKKQITANCKAFQNVMKANGYTCLLYGSRAYLPKKFDLAELEDYLWVARYAGKDTVLDDEKYFPAIEGYNDRIAIWQYANNGTVAGISGKVDLNYMYIDVSKKEEEEVKMIRPVDYKQTDTRWKTNKYAVDGESSTLGSAGCGPTALADCLASIVSPYIDPLTLAAWSRNHNYKVKNSGTSYSFFAPCAKEYGVTVRRLNTGNIYGTPDSAFHSQALAELQAGNWIIACMGKGIWTSSGHYVVVYGCQNGNVYINDPASAKAVRACNKWLTFISQVKYYWVVEVPESIKKNGIVTEGEYRQQDFIREVQMCIGAGIDGIAGSQTLAKTITVSKSKNRKHNVVLPLQKLLKSQGRYVGALDRIAGNQFKEAVNSYQKQILKYKNLDGEVTAKGKMWKKLLDIV